MKSLALCLALFSFVVFADGNVPPNGSTPVAIVSIQAATTCVTGTAAAGSQATVTIPALGGLYFYATFIEMTYSAIAAPAATLMATTTTNFPGSFTISQPMQAAVGDSARVYAFGTPLKAALPGTAVTMVGHTGTTSISQSGKICGFYAP